MRKLIAALIACLMASSTVVFAADGVASPIVVVADEAVENSVQPPRFDVQPAVQAPPEESKHWMERHPVWSGLIVGAGTGYAVGALSCRKGCFPIGPGAAGMLGSWFSAGFGALIGWGVGLAK